MYRLGIPLGSAFVARADYGAYLLVRISCARVECDFRRRRRRLGSRSQCGEDVFREYGLRDWTTCDFCMLSPCRCLFVRLRENRVTVVSQTSINVCVCHVCVGLKILRHFTVRSSACVHIRGVACHALYMLVELGGFGKKKHSLFNVHI